MDFNSIFSIPAPPKTYRARIYHEVIAGREAELEKNGRWWGEWADEIGSSNVYAANSKKELRKLMESDVDSTADTRANGE